MRAIIVCAMLILGGCRQWTGVQMNLVDQARKGIGLCKQSLAQRQDQAKQLTDLQRQRLDEAFDVDVRQTPQLTADWVIEHRRAYVVGIDALNRQENAAREAMEVDRRNLEAIDAALERLHVLQSIELEWEIDFSNLSKEGKP